MMESREKPSAVMLMGPTASGKTELAMELVSRFPMQIISVDSAMVYKGMDIGTAKPSAEELQKAPHRLIDILDPSEPYSAARFREDALREMADISAGGQIPLLVGGTMLYYRALLEGLSELPSSDEAVRGALEEELQQHGLEYLHQRLQEVDPEAASRIHHNDPQRTLRALEVYRITGKSLSLLQKEQKNRVDFPYRVLKIGLLPSDRAVLHERIANRFMKMLKLGFVDEVKTLYDRGDLHVDLPSVRAVGYRQVWSYLAGSFDYNEMVDKGVIATRQLAKRQFTWLRSEKNIQFFDSLDETTGDQLLKCLDQDLSQRY